MSEHNYNRDESAAATLYINQPLEQLLVRVMNVEYKNMYTALDGKIMVDFTVWV